MHFMMVILLVQTKKKKSINYQMIYLWLHFRREKKVAFLTVLNALDVPQYMISNIYP